MTTMMSIWTRKYVYNTFLKAQRTAPLFYVYMEVVTSQDLQQWNAQQRFDWHKRAVVECLRLITASPHKQRSPLR